MVTMSRITSWIPEQSGIGREKIEREAVDRGDKREGKRQHIDNEDVAASGQGGVREGVRGETGSGWRHREGGVNGWSHCDGRRAACETFAS
jgi:hypothetical protein